MLPTIVDDENNPITLVITTIPSFITFNSGDNSFQLSPVNPATSIGMFFVKGYMTDSKLQTDFDFIVSVYNNPPKFKQLPKNCKASIFIENYIDLERADDEEGLTIKYKLTL